MMRFSNALRKEFKNMGKKELADYFTFRKRPRFYFQSTEKSLLKRKLLALKEFYFEKKIADSALNNAFLVGKDDALYEFHIVTKGWAHFGENIDWEKLGGNEKSFRLNRLNFLSSLSLAYFVTGKETYLKKAISLFRDWCGKNPPPLNAKNNFVGVTWRSLDTAIRVINLLWMFYLIKDSEQISPTDKLFIIENILYHGEYLYGINSDPYYCKANWQIHELVALAHLGILFPEFKVADIWNRLAYKKLEEQTKRQFFSDGVHGEGSLSYHVVVAQLYMDAIYIAQLNKQKVSKELRNFTKKMVNFVMTALRPDNTLPLINDSHIVDLDTFVLCAHQIFPKNNWPKPTKSSSKGAILRYKGRLRHIHQKATPVKRTSKLFPEGGFAVMRDEKDNQYLFFDANPAWLPHTHAGKLSFDLYCNGMPLIIDSGNCSYDHYDYGNWYRRTEAHNTVQVNSRDQVLMKDMWKWEPDYNLRKVFSYPNFTKFLKSCDFPKVSINQWGSNELFDFVEAYHEGYCDLINPITHTRKILYIKGKYWIIVDELKVNKENATFASHYEFLLHFLARKTMLNRREKIVNMQNGNVGILVIPLDKDDIDGVVLDKGKVVHNSETCLSPLVKYVKHNRSSASFYTLLLPYKGKVPKVDIEHLVPPYRTLGKDGMGAAIHMGTSTVYFISQSRSGQFNDSKKKINFSGNILWLETKKSKVNSFLAINSKKTEFQNKVLLRGKSAKTLWKIY